MLLGGGLGGASSESCTLMVLAEEPFVSVLDDVLNVVPDGVLDRGLMVLELIYIFFRLMI